MRKCKGRYWGGSSGYISFDLGYFHQWGYNYEEFETGPGNFSVAIVELPDGRVVTPEAWEIQFIDERAEAANDWNRGDGQ